MPHTVEESATRPDASTLPARRTVAVLVGTAFVAACAHLSVPLFFTPVPMTLQPFAVLLVGLVLGPSLGALTMAAYLLEGAVGLPVFTPQGPGGLAQLLGPTGGYLLCYPAAAAVAGALSRVLPWPGGRQRLGQALLGAVAASVLILAAGAGWLGVLTHRPAAVVYHQAVLPFVAGDAIKAVLAALLATGWSRARSRSV
ncbi:MAG TPA: biotin transporter BioY [Acidobacteriaceae bacterium]